MQAINSVLNDLGLEEREIKIYLTLIKNQLTALQLSKETRIDRTTTYDIIERLIDKGIVSTTIKNGTKNFSALQPKDLLLHFKEKYSSLERIMPELNKITNQTQEPVKCEFFQGKEGLKTVLKDLIESRKNYKVIGIKKKYEEIISYFNEQGLLKLNEEKIKEVGIYAKGEKFKRSKHGKYKKIDKGLISPISTVIYGDKVLFFIWTEPYFAIRVENKTFAKGQEEYFELLWRLAE